MAKFSVGIEEDGEGPSNRVPKRPRVVGSISILIGQAAGQNVDVDREGVEEEEEEEGEEEEEEGEEEEDEEEDEDCEEEDEESEAEEAEMTSGVNTDSPIRLTLTDPEVLDCPICCEALTIPVFQCDNGHIACSMCSMKVRQKCPSCATPIGYIRCRAIEKVLESVRILCQNKKYGCTDAFSYNMKQKHDKICSYIPCSCPVADCNFESSSNLLYAHFSDKHKSAAIRFYYDEAFSVNLRKDQKFLILQEKRDDSLFILDNQIHALGNLVTLGRIGPSVERGYFYELSAKAVPEPCNLRLQSFTKSSPKLADSSPSSGFSFLLVPGLFFCPSGKIQVEVRVCKYDQFPRNFHRV